MFIEKKSLFNFQVLTKCLFLIGLFFFCLFISYAENIDLEPITVQRSCLDFNEQINVKDVPYFSPEEIIDYSSSIDLKQRSPFGVQQDISLRGSGFEDVSVNLEGVRINDPQTGHYNLELPLTSADLYDVKLLKNAQAVNFRIKEPRKKGGLFKTTFGEHSLWSELLSVNFLLNDTKNRLSIEHKSSSGARQDTDFDNYNFSFHSLWEKDIQRVEFFFGSAEKKFGADSFYSESYSQEEEQTTQRFFLFKTAAEIENIKWENTAYFKRHSDKFILNRHNPSLYTNFHTTYVYGVKSKLDFYKSWFFSLGLEEEKVTSTNLDNHQRLRTALRLGINDQRVGDFFIKFRVGVDDYKSWDYLYQGESEFGYYIKDNLKLHFSFNRIWRVPSFTELYYISPVNSGNDSLQAQEANNFETGIKLNQDNCQVLLNLFFRDQNDTIDWIKNSSLDPWQAENVGSVQAYGFDFYAENRFPNLWLEKISIGYTYLELSKKNKYDFSKYVFDYNRHKLVNNICFNISGLTIDVITKFCNPVDREKYVVSDLKIEKKFQNFTISLEGMNLFNQGYQEMQGVESAGRWCKISVAYSF